MIKHTLSRAFSTDSPYRGALSEAVLQMQESGEITSMKIKWWKEKRGGGACTVGFPLFSSLSMTLCRFSGHRGGRRRWRTDGGQRRRCFRCFDLGRLRWHNCRHLWDASRRQEPCSGAWGAIAIKLIGKVRKTSIFRFHSCKNSWKSWGSSGNVPEARRLSITRKLHVKALWNTSRVPCRDPLAPSLENKRPSATTDSDPVWRTWTSSIWCPRTKSSIKFNRNEVCLTLRLCSFQFCSHPRGIFRSIVSTIVWNFHFVDFILCWDETIAGRNCFLREIRLLFTEACWRPSIFYRKELKLVLSFRDFSFATRKFLVVDQKNIFYWI